MAKRKTKTKKPFLRGVHLQAAIFLIVYTIISKYVFIRSITSGNNWVAFLVPYTFGVLAGCMFLYLFNHEDFFHFMKDIEAKEKKKEQSLLKKYIHFGKVAAILIIAIIFGPILSALSIRLLLNKVWYKYLLLAAGNIGSTIWGVSLWLGLWKSFV